MTGRGVTPVPLVIPAPFVIPVSSCHSRLFLSFPPPLVIPASSCHSRLLLSFPRKRESSNQRLSVSISA
jgi:hypothetical protein